MLSQVIIVKICRQYSVLDGSRISLFHFFFVLVLIVKKGWVIITTLINIRKVKFSSDCLRTENLREKFNDCLETIQAKKTRQVTREQLLPIHKIYKTKKLKHPKNACNAEKKNNEMYILYCLFLNIL